jgi:hypothetical protein
MLNFARLFEAASIWRIVASLRIRPTQTEAFGGGMPDYRRNWFPGGTYFFTSKFTGA